MNTRLKKLWQNLWVIPFIAAALCMIQENTPDSDTFFLAATGRYIVENGIVPTINPFVIHENFGIIIQQWLFDVIIYAIYEPFGNFGLFCFQVAMYFITMQMLYKYFDLFPGNKTTKKILLAICGIVYLSFTTARPTIISFPILLMMLTCMERYRKTEKKRYLCILPVLALLQINIHATMWPMMFVLMMPYVFPFTLLRKGNIKEQAKVWFARNKYILATMVIMIAVGFMNPNGINGMLYVVKSYGSATGGLTISELRSPTLDSYWGLMILVITICVTVYIHQKKTKFVDEQYDFQEEFTQLSMCIGVSILACMHLRNTWYLILGTTPVILSAISNCSFKFRKKEKEPSTWQLVRRNFICIVLSVLFSYIMFNITSYAENTTKDSEFAPIAAAEYLDQLKKENEDEEIILFTEFNNGAFMEWRGYKVYMDARPELYQKNINGKENVYTEYCNVANGRIDYPDFLSKYEFTHLIVTDNTLFHMYLSQNPDYKAVVDGNGYTLYENIQN